MTQMTLSVIQMKLAGKLVKDGKGKFNLEGKEYTRCVWLNVDSGLRYVKFSGEYYPFYCGYMVGCI